VKAIRNIESNSIGIKSLSSSGDLKVEDKARFFGNIQKISCDVIGEGLYWNHFDKD
jgi:hypothetical protein